LKIETKVRDDHQADVTVEVEGEILEKNKRIAAKRIAKKIKIPGFRPGKAPFNVVQKHVGEGAILEEALDLLLDDVYPNILDEAKLDPYGPGSLTNVPNLDPPTLEITVPLAPEVTLGKYDEVRIPFEAKAVTDEDVDQVIDNIREQQAVIESVDRAAEEGDMVSVAVSGEKMDGEETSTFIEERKIPIMVEKEDKDGTGEWPFPGYSRHLIGLSAGDEKTVEHTFSDDYEHEELQGVKASFPTKVEEIKARKLPEKDDELAKSAGEYENLEALVEEVRKSLEERFESDQNAEYESQIVEAVIEQSNYKYPPQMIEHEINHQIEDLTRSLRSQGLEMDVYLKSRDISLEDLQKELRPQAEERIKRGLTLLEIAKVEKIEAEDKAVEERVNNMTNEIQQIFPEDEARKLLTPEYLANLRSQIRNDEVISQTLGMLRSIAKGEAGAAEEEAKEEPKKAAPKAKKAAPKKKSKATKTEEAPDEKSEEA